MEVEVDLQITVWVVLESTHPDDGPLHRLARRRGRLGGGRSRDLRLEQHAHVVEIGQVTPDDLRIVAQLEQQRVEPIPLPDCPDAHTAAVAYLHEPPSGERAD